MDPSTNARPVPREPRDPNAKTILNGAGEVNRAVRKLTSEDVQKRLQEKREGMRDERIVGHSYESLERALSMLQQLDRGTEQPVLDKLVAAGEIQSAHDSEGNFWIDATSRASWWRAGGRGRLAELNREALCEKNAKLRAAAKQPSAEELSAAARTGDGLAAERLRQQRAAEQV